MTSAITVGLEDFGLRLDAIEMVSIADLANPFRHAQVEGVNRQPTPKSNSSFRRSTARKSPFTILVWSVITAYLTYKCIGGKLNEVKCYMFQVDGFTLAAEIIPDTNVRLFILFLKTKVK